MKKSIFLLFYLHNLIVERFSFQILHENLTWTSTVRVCDERSMLKRCDYSASQHLKSIPTAYNDDKMTNNIQKEIVLVCPIDAFVSSRESTLDEIARFEDACRDHTSPGT